MPVEGSIEERNATANHDTEVQDVLDKPEQSAQEAYLAEIKLSTSMKAMSLDDKSNEFLKPSREERYAAQVEADSRSIFVGNITSEITPEIIEEHFKNCGNIKRITLLYDKNTGAPKGYAYVEFNSIEEQRKALEYNGSNLKETVITVYKKRTNLPGYRRRFQYRNSSICYQQQWGHSQDNYQAHGIVDIYRQFNFKADHSQSFDRYNGGYGQRHNRRGNGRQDHRLNLTKSRTSKEPTATPQVSSIESDDKIADSLANDATNTTPN
ncbi:hypothetical protein HG536_0F03190 [Torulaspora globosa]|uniref:RRM domain-containing protein n=1 Tax=Torulaspora globosa TaxID=48254 RepID=A0A7G3ZKF8_9SACH|nr:uncharacterized protein HG536_0F03190 [Torulaspora globosa]QLL33994.1 hypothetical protein HG536_0F03190 [Torulaspora globosa]